MIRKELYYTLYDAECAAVLFAEKNDGYVVGAHIETKDIYPLRGTIEPNHVDCTDYRFTRNTEHMELPAELDAVRVVNKDTLEDIGLFGYLEDMVD